MTKLFADTNVLIRFIIKDDEFKFNTVFKMINYLDTFSFLKRSPNA